MLSAKNYISIVLIFLVIFIVFMSVALATENLAGVNIDSLAGPSPEISAHQGLSENFFNDGGVKLTAGSEMAPGKRRAALITSGPGDAMASVLWEWCLYNKYSCHVFNGFPPAAELKAFDLVLHGDLPLGSDNIEAWVELLGEYEAAGVPMIFTSLPPFDALLQFPRLADFFGIQACVHPSYAIDGIRVFDGFFLSRERRYNFNDYSEKKDMTLEIPYYTLRPGYEAYAVAILEEQGSIKDEDLPPLLWRTYSGSSFVFVVNGDVFSGKTMLGITSAFLSQAHPAYLYPVVNGQAVTVLNFPAFAQENGQEIMARYTRTPEGFKRDILWPNMVRVLKHYDQSYDFFATPGLDQAGKDSGKDQGVLTYWKEIAKLKGALGLSLEEPPGRSLTKAAADKADFFEDILPGYRFTALYGGNFSLAQLGAYFKDRPAPLLDHVSLVLANDQEGEMIFQYLNDQVLAILMTKNGFEHEIADDLQMVALETSLGFCLQQVNMARALFPVGEEDNWNHLAEGWSAGKTYYRDFRFFGEGSIYELESRVRKFLALDYDWQYEKNKVEVQIDNFQEEAWFVLRLHQAEIEKIRGGDYKSLSPGIYLIRAREPGVSVKLREINFLYPPGEGWK